MTIEHPAPPVEHRHGWTVHAHPHGDELHDHAWKLPSPPLRRQRAAAGAGSSIALVVVGLVVMAALGHNYGVCQNVLVQAANSGACAQASLWHWAGIIIAVIGGLCFIEEITRRFRR